MQNSCLVSSYRNQKKKKKKKKENTFEVSGLRYKVVLWLTLFLPLKGRSSLKIVSPLPKQVPTLELGFNPIYLSSPHYVQSSRTISMEDYEL